MTTRTAIGFFVLGTLALGCSDPPQPPATAGASDAPAPVRARAAVHAGSWYPADAATLRREITTRLEKKHSEPGPAAAPIIAMVGPHAGLRFSGEVAAAGYAALRHQKVARVFLLGPSHHDGYGGIALPPPGMVAYRTPLGELAIDRGAVEALRGQPGFEGPPRAQAPEHSLEMHAIFIAAIAPEARIVPLVVGRLGNRVNVREIANTLRPLLRADDVVVVSSDFTHYGPRYGYLPFTDHVELGLRDLLAAAVAPLLHPSLDRFETHLQKTSDTICGREAIRLLLALLPAGIEGERLASDYSGRMAGDYRNTVTYFTAAYRHFGGWSQSPNKANAGQTGPVVLGEEERQLALRAARTTLEAYLREQRVPTAEELGIPTAGPMRDVHGTFVTLNENGHLRGCIGHILPVQALWQDVRDNAIAAAVHDGRFKPVEASELATIDLEISVLTLPRPISGPTAFEIGRHGVVLRALGRQATFLPQVAPEQGWDRDTTLNHLARKAGLPENVWRSADAELSVYEAQVFGESRLSQ